MRSRHGDASPPTALMQLLLLLVDFATRKPSLSMLIRAVLAVWAMAYALSTWHRNTALAKAVVAPRPSAHDLVPPSTTSPGRPPLAAVRFGYVPIPEVQRLADQERAFILGRFHANQSRALWDYVRLCASARRGH